MRFKRGAGWVNGALRLAKARSALGIITQHLLPGS